MLPARLLQFATGGGGHSQTGIKLGVNPSSLTSKLCVLGQVSQPLLVLVSLGNRTETQSPPEGPCCLNAQQLPRPVAPPLGSGEGLLSPAVSCSTVRPRMAVSSSAGLALKLKVSLYTGLAEPSTTDVFLHLTNLLWFIRDTLTNTPEGQCRQRTERHRQGPKPLACGRSWGGGTCPPRCQDPITHSRYSQRALQEETGLISVLP